MSHVRNVQLTKDDIVTILLAPKSLAVSAIESSGLPDCQLLPEDVSNFLDQRRISQAYASQPSSQPASYPSLLGVPRLSAKEETLRKNGVPGLYQPQSFTVAWYDYQQWLVNSLSERIAGMVRINSTDGSHLADLITQVQLWPTIPPKTSSSRLHAIRSVRPSLTTPRWRGITNSIST